MVGNLLLRGMVAGVIAGILVFAFARFFGGRSGNKARYARLLADAVPLDRIPGPIAAVLTAAAG